MSGGVDSSVAAARLLDAGHEVVGVTMKLWGGESDTGCCSVSDVDDARRVAQQLGIAHHVWSFTDDFEQHVVGPYVEAHRTGRTPTRASSATATSSSTACSAACRPWATTPWPPATTPASSSAPTAPGAWPGAPTPAKDQSYVLYVLGQGQLARTLLPVGDMTKDEVRAEAVRLGLRTADKPDSQDVCFVTSAAGRPGFLGRRIPLRPGRVVEAGEEVGHVDAVELVTIGQRRGLGLAGGAAPRYVVDVDVPGATVTVGTEADLQSDQVVLDRVVWPTAPSPGPSPPSAAPMAGPARPGRAARRRHRAGHVRGTGAPGGERPVGRPLRGRRGGRGGEPPSDR